MTWFKHRHYFRAMPPVASVEIFEKGKIERDIERPSHFLLIQHCQCGAVRQVEIRDGTDPVIRITEPPTEKEPPTVDLGFIQQMQGMRKALEPFAREADNWTAHAPDSYHPTINENGVEERKAAFTVGDLRRAQVWTPDR